MKQEVAILSQLDHPHIVRYCETVAEGDSLGIVMEYVEGLALSDRCAWHNLHTLRRLMCWVLPF